TRAAAIGLVWACVDDPDLLDEATRLAGRAADLPRELARRVKASLRETPRLASLDDAVAVELERQRWSLEQGFFAEQRAKMEARRGRSCPRRDHRRLDGALRLRGIAAVGGVAGEGAGDARGRHRLHLPRAAAVVRDDQHRLPSHVDADPDPHRLARLLHALLDAARQ